MVDFKHLKILQLANNKFKGSINSLPKHVEIVQLARNEFNGIIRINFEDALSLKEFNGDYNYFVGTIPTSIAMLKKLETCELFFIFYSILVLMYLLNYDKSFIEK